MNLKLRQPGYLFFFKVKPTISFRVPKQLTVAIYFRREKKNYGSQL